MVRCMGAILQQSENSANLIKLRKHVHSDYGFDPDHHCVDPGDAAIHVGRISILMVNCNEWCIFCMDQCICVATDEDATPNSTAALAAG